MEILKKHPGTSNLSKYSQLHSIIVNLLMLSVSAVLLNAGYVSNWCICFLHLLVLRVCSASSSVGHCTQAKSYSTPPVERGRKHIDMESSCSHEVTSTLCWMWTVLLPVACSEMNSSLCKMLPQWDKMIIPCLVWLQFLSLRWCEIFTKCQWATTAPQRDTMRTNVTFDHGWKMTRWGKNKRQDVHCTHIPFFSPTE